MLLRASASPTRRTPGCASCSPATCDDDDRLAEALALLRAHPALEQARETTRGVGAEAVALLAPLPESEAKAALTALVTSVVDRVG